MLKTNELRIGNLVIYASKIVEIEGINKNTIYHSKGQFDQNIEPAYEPFRQIQLTEDWLLKFGFIKDQPEGWFYKQPIDILNQRFLLFKHKDLPYYYADGCFSPYLKYVHQLQNLYYSLTGEELRLSH